MIGDLAHSYCCRMSKLRQIEQLIFNIVDLSPNESCGWMTVVCGHVDVLSNMVFRGDGYVCLSRANT